ncbi:hypothetical protein RHCRD62_30147 [Rhodococcus sp. RD6.2]|nr:hypothetical protein RHCRD62_30147 [Rhodococcus sp. RD6.2]
MWRSVRRTSARSASAADRRPHGPRTTNGTRRFLRVPFECPDGSGMHRHVREATPREGDGRVHRLLLRDGPVRLQPVARGELAGPDQADREDAGAVGVEPRIVGDQVEHGVDTRLGGAVHLRLNLGVAHEVRFEHQAVPLALVVDEIEERLDRGAHALTVVGRRPECLTDTRDEAVHVALEHCEVEVELAGEVLVQHRLTDARAFGDLVHACRVVSATDEHLARGLEQLESASVAGESGAALRTLSPGGRCGTIREFSHRAPNLRIHDSVPRAAWVRVLTAPGAQSHRTIPNLGSGIRELADTSAPEYSRSLLRPGLQSVPGPRDAGRGLFRRSSGRGVDRRARVERSVDCETLVP